MFLEANGRLCNLNDLVGHEIETDYDEEGRMIGHSLYLEMRDLDGLVEIRNGFDGRLHAWTFLTMCIRKAHHFGICERKDMDEIYKLSDHMKHVEPEARNLAVLGLASERSTGGAI